MSYAQWGVGVAGLLLLLFGYRKINRNLMLIGALLLWFGGQMEDAVHGFEQGWNAAHSKPDK